MAERAAPTINSLMRNMICRLGSRIGAVPSAAGRRDDWPDQHHAQCQWRTTLGHPAARLERFRMRLTARRHRRRECAAVGRSS